MTKNAKKGFTLVELLVVIGIIAVLISILLPSLSRARQAALSLQCAANLRTIGQALAMYVDSNKGCYPLGVGTYDPDGVGNSGDEEDRYVTTTLASTLSGASLAPWDTEANAQMAYFKCPSVVAEVSYPWTPSNHYSGHPICFPLPGWGFNWGSAETGLTVSGYWTMYKATWMAKNGTEKAIFWDGNVDMDPISGNPGMAQPTGLNVDGDRFFWDTDLVDIPEIWSIKNPDSAGNDPDFRYKAVSLNGVFKDKPGNRGDGIGSGDFFRARHSNNSVVNILFADGHVESRTCVAKANSLDTGTTDLTHANFLVPYQGSRIRSTRIAEPD